MIRPGKEQQEEREEGEEKKNTGNDDGSDDDDAAWVRVEDLPIYLQRAISESSSSSLLLSPTTTEGRRVRVLDLEEIGKLKTQEEQWTGLLLLRHNVTQAMMGGGGGVGGGDGLVRPELILKRARCHEALGYDELAVGDAYAAFTLASGESEDLVERTVSADGMEEWDVDGHVAAEVRVGSVRLLARGLRRLGAVSEAERWEGVLRGETEGKEQTHDGGGDEDEDEDEDRQGLEGIYGRCQRVVYPWNSHEPERMSAASLAEINERLRQASDGMLECRKTVLPSLSPTPIPSTSSSTTTTENAQLGLFANRRLGPSTAILRERSCLTAIRPHDAALCDCCAADLESVGVAGLDGRVECPGCETTLFCSRECLELAGRSYHRPNLGGGGDYEEEEEGGEEYAPASTPFCGGPAGSETPFTDLGRAESSTTPEWDLYFLLVVRCIQMAITQDVHPLDLFEVKYLWGGFSSSSSSSNKKKKKEVNLPFSFHHHVSLPFQLFESLLLSVRGLHPYSGVWLERFDFWTINTLYAKFRGVATANQSSFDGKAETAAVHALWCLANHSCGPNVSWEAGGGVRVLRVREDEGGIDEGGEVWNHYTDVREADVWVRRGRLQEVLGGECMCERCVREAGEGEEEEKEDKK